MVIATLKGSLLLLNTGQAREANNEDEHADFASDEEEDSEHPLRGDELGDNPGDAPNWQRDVTLSDSSTEEPPSEEELEYEKLFQSDQDPGSHSSLSDEV